MALENICPLGKRSMGEKGDDEQPGEIAITIANVVFICSERGNIEGAMDQSNLFS